MVKGQDQPQTYVCSYGRVRRRFDMGGECAGKLVEG